ncbi:FAD:protein FMN transferase [Streptomyces massasporeus]|uniref:FAD:protein FMN transferase n=1 Tax=Streptomyces massasporeus TaxID=67324 RepID=UPI003403CB6F
MNTAFRLQGDPLSSVERRRRGGPEAHHPIDPRTGEPAAGDIAAVTVVAQQAAFRRLTSSLSNFAGRGASRT